MKYRLIAGLLLLVIALTACSSAGTSTGNDLPSGITRPDKPTDAAATTDAAAATEAQTEAPTETEAPTQYPADVDLGSLSGSTYKNETIGVTCSFPSDWYIYNETDLAAYNNLVSQRFDNTVITSAIESGQVAIIFCASQTETYSSVNISAEKNQTLGFSDEAVINFSIPLLKAELEQNGITNIVCDIVDIVFGGQTHKAIDITGDVSGMQYYETIVYMPCGEYLYAVAGVSLQKTIITDMLNLFEPID